MANLTKGSAAIVLNSPSWTNSIERAWLQGAFITAIAYGIEFILYTMTSFSLWKSWSPLNRRRNLIFIFYTSLIFTLSTLYIAGLFEFLQESFIDGNIAPLESRLITSKLPLAITLANNTMIVKGWLCDIINIWRSIVIYWGCRIPSWLVNLVPSLLYLATIGLGILSLCTDLPIIALVLTRTSLVPLVYFVISLSLNILITTLLALRLLVCRTRIAQVLGRAHGAQYTNLAAMIVESAAIHSFVAILVIITISIDNATIPGQVCLLLLPPLQDISSFLIVLRVAQGKAWSRDTCESAEKLSTLRFTAESVTVEQPDSTST
ncbi:hypothetical protein D9756_009938 [Leucocoprinus leucothites]|uniref:Uncharacterized protein n=1 Tax=Leucocoprinus leucothites TaxID=201217 RepID=A0A8H5CUH6_9AGAR|nr:hypothetical protein D9756_009938 [Leucoagaricus leucothites]